MENTLWIVTEDDLLRQELPALLQPLGYTHRLYKRTRSALRALERQDPPALILIDSAALDLLARVRQKPRFVHLPVVVITVAANDNAVEQLFSRGADGCINRPVIAAGLATVIKAALQRRRGIAT